MVPVQGDPKAVSSDLTGTQTVEIVREDAERSGENGKVYVQKATEVAKPAAGGEDSAGAPKGPRLVGELYFRINDRGIWLISDGEPDDKGESIEKVTDRRLPLLWMPPGLKSDKAWTITCQIDTTIKARLTCRAGEPRQLKINGATYENCLPVLSVADHLTGFLDLGFGLAPIREGRMVDLTWYAPGIGAVRSHQLANFVLEPPNRNFTEARSHYEETQEIEPGYRASE